VVVLCGRTKPIYWNHNKRDDLWGSKRALEGLFWYWKGGSKGWKQLDKPAEESSYKNDFRVKNASLLSGNTIFLKLIRDI